MSSQKEVCKVSKVIVIQMHNQSGAVVQTPATHFQVVFGQTF